MQVNSDWSRFMTRVEITETFGFHFKHHEDVRVYYSNDSTILIEPKDNLIYNVHVWLCHHSNTYLNEKLKVMIIRKV